MAEQKMRERGEEGGTEFSARAPLGEVQKAPGFKVSLSPDFQINQLRQKAEKGLALLPGSPLQEEFDGLVKKEEKDPLRWKALVAKVEIAVAGRLKENEETYEFNYARSYEGEGEGGRVTAAEEQDRLQAGGEINRLRKYLGKEQAFAEE